MIELLITMFSFFSKSKLSNLLVLALLIALAFLRFFSFQESVEFNSDFGRDSLFAMRILTEKPTKGDWLHLQNQKFTLEFFKVLLFDNHLYRIDIKIV